MEVFSSTMITNSITNENIMNKRIFELLLMIVSTMGLLVSCQNDCELADLSFDNTHFTQTDSKITPSKEILDSLDKVEPFYIESFDDLATPMKESSKIVKNAIKEGIFDTYPISAIQYSRVSLTEHTAYVKLPMVMTEEIDKKLYFKSKFGANVVNLINAVVGPDRKISTGTTYCCYWNVYYHKIILESNQKFGIDDSPRCALQPDTRTSYIERGYDKEIEILNDGRTQVEMYSFELYILYKDTKGSTIRLDIYYPAIIDTGLWQGYEFKYNILTQ